MSTGSSTGIDVVVANRKRGVPAGYTDVNVGRPSVFGNPFKVIGKGGTMPQEEAALAFLPHLEDACRTGGALKDAVVRLAFRAAGGERLALVCWCAPLPCHAEHLASAVLGYARVIRGAWDQGQAAYGVSEAQWLQGCAAAG